LNAVASSHSRSAVVKGCWGPVNATIFLNERRNVGTRFPLGSMETKGIATEFDSRAGDHNEVSNTRGCDLSTEHTGGDSNDMEGV
jgi:hypothetical protein